MYVIEIALMSINMFLCIGELIPMNIHRGDDLVSYICFDIIQPNYCTCSYKGTVKQFRSLQITASVIFVYFFVKAYGVGTHLNCIDLSMQFK